MPGTSATDNDVTLLKAGVATGPNKATVTNWGSNELVSYIWSGADLAGFAAADLDSATFGVQLSAKATAGAPTVNVDYIQITVTYTLGDAVHKMAMMGIGG